MGGGKRMSHEEEMKLILEGGGTIIEEIIVNVPLPFVFPEPIKKKTEVSKKGKK